METNLSVIIKDVNTPPSVFVKQDNQIRAVDKEELSSLINSYTDPMAASEVVEIAELSAAKWVFYAQENDLLNIHKIPVDAIDEYTSIQLDWVNPDIINDNMSQGVVELVRILAESGKIENAIKLFGKTGFVGSHTYAREHVAKVYLDQGDVERARDIIDNTPSTRFGCENRKFECFLEEYNTALKMLKKTPEPNINIETLRSELKNMMSPSSSPVQGSYHLPWDIRNEVRSYCNLGEIFKAIDFAKNSLRINDQAIALKYMTRFLAKQQHYEHADIIAEFILELADMTEDEDDREGIYRDYANAMGAIGKFVTAFQYHNPYSPEEFIEDIAKWYDSLTLLDDKLALLVMQRTLPIIASIRPYWQDITKIVVS